MNVLVIDDSITMRRIIINTLTHPRILGYKGVVLEASNGKEGLQKLREGDVDIIITAWKMPGMGGLEFVKEVRSSSYKDVPILMLTTNSEKADVVAALKAGVTNYIVKPFTPEAMEMKINSMRGNII